MKYEVDDIEDEDNMNNLAQKLPIVVKYNFR